MNESIDIIVPYVNCWDPVWLNLASKNLKTIIFNSFRDLGTIKYFFRGVEQNMPWIRNVYFVVQSPSQIPTWLNVNHPKLKIIYHSDFVPNTYLPTYNSIQFELFYYKIKGLSNKFIIANDDMVAIQPLTKENFFNNGKIVYTTKKYENLTIDKCLNDFGIILYNTAKAVGKITGKNNCTLYEHKHLFTPHLKSLYKLGWEKYKKGLIDSFKDSKERTNKNILHYLFLFLAQEMNLVENDKNCVDGYVELFDDTDTKNIITFLKDNNSKVCCINDKLKLTNDTKAKKMISSILDVYLPNKSTFEY